MIEWKYEQRGWGGGMMFLIPRGKEWVRRLKLL
jgi:hypothetical protein